MKWSDPQDRADRRLRLGIWAAAIMALLLPIWWNVVDAAWTAIVLRASMQAAEQVLRTPAPVPSVSRSALPVPAPARAPYPVRVLGATIGETGIVNVLVDLGDTTPEQSRERTCRDAGAFLRRSLAGSTLRILRSRGREPALDAGTLQCP